MVTNIDELICYADEDAPGLERIRQAVEWLCDKPEVIEVLRKAHERQRQPLTIRLESGGETSAAYDGYYHEVIIDPEICESPPEVSGVKPSLERILAHEILHSSQPDEGEYDEARELIDKLAYKYRAQTPRAGYGQRIAAARNEGQLTRIFGEIFDKEIVHTLPASLEQLKEEMRKSDVIQRFFSEIESPALEFENRIMGKYRGEAAASLDYVDSVMPISRENYVSRQVKKELHDRKVKAEIASWGLDENGNATCALR